MEYIIFDLEATCWEGNQMGRNQEIIEIGAFRLDHYGKIEDEFQRFVKPTIYPVLSAYCRKLTGIEQSDIDSARAFRTAGNQFMEWIHNSGEDYCLCSWGAKDHALLVHDCRNARMETEWLDHYIDLKAQYHDFRNLSQKIGLKKALLREGIEFDGAHHRALDDARNLTELFVRHLDMWTV
jgi:inhibitor of KinA sporulation pathway (predicted exonuclease)